MSLLVFAIKPQDGRNGLSLSLVRVRNGFDGIRFNGRRSQSVVAGKVLVDRNAERADESWVIVKRDRQESLRWNLYSPFCLAADNKKCDGWRESWVYRDNLSKKNNKGRLSSGQRTATPFPAMWIARVEQDILLRKRGSQGAIARNDVKSFPWWLISRICLSVYNTWGEATWVTSSDRPDDPRCFVFSLSILVMV